ncbi:hypothetical protein BO71DRAFT_402404 [Aspergillus ellipticus CBS 707.79]|uniref:Uncharacterized protein n=1 Tax=Aspergillus ellipticus CBS 707.79 TaxID=1448320 RepID=A0A319CYB7_9EURO|nr:hypothetical protein BO71DRAFT_402404 [Aspergillus ellipticus CBS 707.79]
MKFFVAVASLLVAVGVAMPIPVTNKAARFEGSDLIDGLANSGGLMGFLQEAELPLLSDNKDDAGAGDAAGDAAGAGKQ